jgi:hypothetical protein
MALEAVSDKCEVDTTGGTIVLSTDRVGASAAYPELEGMAARNMAIKVASELGLPDPRVSGNVDIFAVDTNTGEEILRDVPEGANVQFRASIPVTKRLI